MRGARCCSAGCYLALESSVGDLGCRGPDNRGSKLLLKVFENVLQPDVKAECLVRRKAGR